MSKSHLQTHGRLLVSQSTSTHGIINNRTTEWQDIFGQNMSINARNEHHIISVYRIFRHARTHTSHTFRNKEHQLRPSFDVICTYLQQSVVKLLYCSRQDAGNVNNLGAELEKATQLYVDLQESHVHYEVK